MKYFNASIRNLTYRLRKFDEILAESLEEIIVSLEDVITQLVSEEQLYKQGINGKGVKIMDYAPYAYSTTRNKRRKGQPTNRVTLRDTGDFHKSFFVVFDEGGFYITAADKKLKALEAKYGEAIFRLTNENLTYLLRNYVRPALAERLKNKLGI